MLIFQGWGGTHPNFLTNAYICLFFGGGGYPWRPNPCLYNTFTAPNTSVFSKMVPAIGLPSWTTIIQRWWNTAPPLKSILHRIPWQKLSGWTQFGKRLIINLIYGCKSGCQQMFSAHFWKNFNSPTTWRNVTFFKNLPHPPSPSRHVIYQRSLCKRRKIRFPPPRHLCRVGNDFAFS